jgi:hypothetical protein
VDGTTKPGSSVTYIVGIRLQQSEARSIIESWRSKFKGRGDMSFFHATTRRKYEDERGHIVTKYANLRRSIYVMEFRNFQSPEDYVYSISTMHRKFPADNFVLDWDVETDEQKRIRNAVREQDGAGFDLRWGRTPREAGLQVVDAVAYTVLLHFHGAEFDAPWEHIKDQVVFVHGNKKVRTP